MKILLLHQNFPGQFRQLLPFLLERDHELVAICSHPRPVLNSPRLRIIRYKEPKNLNVDLSGSCKIWQEALLRAEIVGRLLLQLDSEGWQPDCVLAHSGWGEALPVKDIWPQTSLVVWPELWLRPEHMGFIADSKQPQRSREIQLLNLGRNTLTQASLASASAWVLPTQHQADSFPDAFHSDRMHIIHEGIDCSIATPNPTINFEFAGVFIDRSLPVVTFVNRNLERLRGFDTFMRALPMIQERFPSARVLIVGDNEGGYGGGHPSGRPLKEIMLEELENKLNLQNIHFLGRIPHSDLIRLLQCSWVHVYLSYPFILGWSLIEAMACGCCIVGSHGAPVNEVINDGVEGALVPIQDHSRLARRVIALLGNPKMRVQMEMLLVEQLSLGTNLIRCRVLFH